jgi:hypothetical protein
MAPSEERKSTPHAATPEPVAIIAMTQPCPESVKST